MKADAAIDPEALVRKLYACFNARDAAGISDLVHPDVEWVNAPKGLHSRGIHAMRERWSKYWELAEIVLTPLVVTPTPTGMFVKLREQITNHDGVKVFDGLVGHNYTLQDGKVLRCDIVDANDGPT